LFVAQDVPEGDYVLGAHSCGAKRQEGAYAEVTVRSGSTAFALQTNTGATISGRIIVNGQPAGSSGTERLNAHVYASAPPRMFGYRYFNSRPIQPENTDRFTITGLRGPVQLGGNAAAGAQLSIRQGARDLSTETLVLSGKERIDDVVVEVTTKVARAEVHVRAAQDSAAGQTVSVIVFADDPSISPRAFRRAYHIESASTSTAGTNDRGVELIRMPPGKYWAIAIPEVPLDDASHPELLAVLRPHATPITLVAGELTTVTISVSEVPAEDGGLTGVLTEANEGRPPVNASVSMAGTIAPPAKKEPTLATLGRALREATPGAIEGVVVDEHGVPVRGAAVHPLRRSDSGGHDVFYGRRQQARTNDLGRFRLYDLAPGDYRVVALHAVVRGGHPLTYQLLIPPTWYPSTVSEDAAKVVTVRSGETTRGIDFTVSRRPPVTLSAVVTDSRGQTLGLGAEVKLQKPSLYLAGVNQFMPVARREPDGRFVFEDVAPGEYRLIVNNGGPAAEGAAVTITVGDSDQTVNVRTNAGATMTGQVVVDGQPPDQALFDGLRIHALPLRPYDGDGAKVAEARVKPDGGFTLNGLRGATRFEVDGSGAVLLAIKRGADDITRDVFQFLGEEHLTGVVIEMTAKVGTVDITVTRSRKDAGGVPVDVRDERTLVVFFLEDPVARRRGHIKSYVTDVCREESARRATSCEVELHFRDLPPGRYLAVAVPADSSDAPNDERVLERLRPLAKPVTIAAGVRAAVKIVALPALPR
jgi:hypothetical protein